MNKQPFYHTATILFTATESINGDQLATLLMKALEQMTALERSTIIPDSIVTECIDSEPGDPADLVE